MSDMKIAIIGAGNMASALIEGLVTRRVIPARSIIATNRSTGKLEKLQAAWDVRTTYDNRQAASAAQVIILAVKPSDVQPACEQINRDVDGKVVISIAAGIRIETLKRWLGCDSQPVVRVMPNTPAQIGLGIAGWTASAEVSGEQVETVQKILSCLGKDIYFADESLLDQVTAISGSGPAYVFYLAEILTESAKHIGLSEVEATELVLQTIYGAATMLRNSTRTPSELKRAVTSKGGTTEAALDEFARGKLDVVVKRGVSAAHRRGTDIGDQWSGSVG